MEKTQLRLVSLLFITILLFFTLNNKAYANVSMPGFWNVGTGRSIEPVSLAEIKTAENIQMKKENISVLLYKNFAVVKGHYEMLNTSTKPISVTMGYPEHGIFYNKEVENVVFNELQALKVAINDKETTFTTKESELSKSNLNEWYTWSVNFAPKTITQITVYYLVDTSFAVLKKGYSSISGNGFAYIVESGKVWKDKIGEGTVTIKLMDDLTEENLFNITPSKVQYDETNQALVYNFKNLEPEHDDNIVIRYRKIKTGINFESITKEALKYYQEVDKLDMLKIDTNNLKTLEKDSFKASSSGLDDLILMMLAIIFVVVVGFIFVLYKIFWEKDKYERI